MTLKGPIRGLSPPSKPNPGSPGSRLSGTEGLHRGGATTTIWPLARPLHAATDAMLDGRRETRRHSMKRAGMLAVGFGLLSLLVFSPLPPPQARAGPGRAP